MLAPLFLVMIAEFKFVIHHLAVARPLHRGVGAAHAEAVGDVVDRLLAVDLGQFAQRLGVDPREFRHVVFGARGELELAARRLQDMQRKRHAVAHLPRLWNRRQYFGGGDILGQALILAAACRTALGPDRARQGRRRSAQHRREGRIALAVAIGGSGKIEQPQVVAVHQADLFPAAGSKCREFHRYLPCTFDKIYDH